MAMNFVTFNQDYSCLAVGALFFLRAAILANNLSPRYLAGFQDIPY
jgi:hypothetical protein